MKKTFILIFALCIAFSMISCNSLDDVPAAPSGSGNGSETPGGDASAYLSESDTDLPPEDVFEYENGKKYGDYQVIILENPEDIELINNMWNHESWFSVNAASGDFVRQFETYVLTGNPYMTEILEREDAIDLLLWQYDRFAQNPEIHSIVKTPNYNFGCCFRSEQIISKMTEEQKTAARMMQVCAQNWEMVQTGELISSWQCKGCIYVGVLYGNEPPESCPYCKGTEFELELKIND